MPEPKHLLVIRFSSMGDVVLAVPAVHGVLGANPGVEITIVSNKIHEPFFNGIENVRFHGIQLENYRGIPGLFRLYRELYNMQKWNAIIDLHDVMRSWVISFLFKIGGYPVFILDKGRKEKRELTRKVGKRFQQLEHTTERYADVFRRAGFEIELPLEVRIKPTVKGLEWRSKFLSKEGNAWKDRPLIGIAPFSKHKEKEWPLHHMKEFIQFLDERGNVEVFLFGASSEANGLKELALPYNSVRCLAGEITIEQQIALMPDLNVLISMDSFNMHLASMCSTPVISIWGATHPHAGFRPWNEKDNHYIQIDHRDLSCRPCSVFGDKPCFRGDHACMEWITPEKVQKTVSSFI